MVPRCERRGKHDQDLRGLKPVSQHYIQITVSPALVIVSALMILKIDSSLFVWDSSVRE